MKNNNVFVELKAEEQTSIDGGSITTAIRFPFPIPIIPRLPRFPFPVLPRPPIYYA